jgi:hypothetical protein
MRIKLFENFDNSDAIDLKVQYFASVNGGTFTDIEQGKDIRLISSIKINYVINED